jgi:O-antigen ligase
MPAWWALGLDQPAWIVVGLVVAAGALPKAETRLAVLLASFLLVMVAAALISVDGIRWLTFARELLIVSAFAGSLLATSAWGWEAPPTRALVLGLLTFASLSAVASLASFATQSGFSFTTAISGLVPEPIAATGLGRLSFVDRSLGEPSYFLGMEFVRPRGLFLFSTSQAVALATAVPLLLAMPVERGARRTVGAAAIVIVLAVLATTTRVPILALGIAIASTFAIRQVWRLHANRHSGRPAVLAVGLAVGALVLALAIPGATERLGALASTRSLEGRANLYAETVSRWAERPLLGWGTEQDAERDAPATAPDPRPPLGSHSLYLGVLFKQGVVGAAIIIALLACVGARAVRLLRRGTASDGMLAAAFVVTLIAGATESLWLDPATAAIVGVAWGAAASEGRALDRPSAERTGA